jgi:hypothetical protein
MLQNSVRSSKFINNKHTTQHVFFHKENSIIFDRFFAADYDSVLEFFLARQDFELIGFLSVKKWHLLQYIRTQILKANFF